MMHSLSKRVLLLQLLARDFPYFEEYVHWLMICLVKFCIIYYIINWYFSKLSSFHTSTETWMWWCIPLTTALRKQKREDLFEFQTSLVYMESSRTARSTVRPWRGGGPAPWKQLWRQWETHMYTLYFFRNTRLW